jgi:hypothetical protein
MMASPQIGAALPQLLTNRCEAAGSRKFVHPLKPPVFPVVAHSKNPVNGAEYFFALRKMEDVLLLVAETGRRKTMPERAGPG